MNKCSSSNVNRTFIESCQAFSNILKTLAQKHYLYIIHGIYLFEVF